MISNNNNQIEVGDFDDNNQFNDMISVLLLFYCVLI